MFSFFFLGSVARDGGGIGLMCRSLEAQLNGAKESLVRETVAVVPIRMLRRMSRRMSRGRRGGRRKDGGGLVIVWWSFW